MEKKTQRTKIYGMQQLKGSSSSSMGVVRRGKYIAVSSHIKTREILNQ